MVPMKCRLERKALGQDVLEERQLLLETVGESKWAYGALMQILNGERVLDAASADGDSRVPFVHT